MLPLTIAKLEILVSMLFTFSLVCYDSSDHVCKNFTCNASGTQHYALLALLQTFTAVTIKQLRYSHPRAPSPALRFEGFSY